MFLHCSFFVLCRNWKKVIHCLQASQLWSNILTNRVQAFVIVLSRKVFSDTHLPDQTTSFAFKPNLHKRQYDGWSATEAAARGQNAYEELMHCLKKRHYHSTRSQLIQCWAAEIKQLKLDICMSSIYLCLPHCAEGRWGITVSVLLKSGLQVSEAASKEPVKAASIKPEAWAAQVYISWDSACCFLCVHSCALLSGSSGSWDDKADYWPCIYNRLMCRHCPVKDKKKASASQVTLLGTDQTSRPMCVFVCVFTFGPQRACLVTQQISVLHIRQQIQSQPSFFWTMMSHRGHFMASPFCSRPCSPTQSNSVKCSSCIIHQRSAKNSGLKC